MSSPLLNHSSPNIAPDATDTMLPRDVGRFSLPRHLALRLALLVCCSLVLLLVSTRAAQANAIVVTDDGDTPSANCTLREAIENANNDDQSGSANCTVGGGNDTITFHADLTGSTIILTSGALSLTSNIDIVGGGVITVSANHASRIFDTTGGSVTLSGLTLRDGNANDGGAVRTVSGTLGLIDSTVLSNTASGYGGGVLLQASTALISNTQFISNFAGLSGGGAAVMTMTLQLLNTDFLSNTAAGNLIGNGGGGLWSNNAITQTGGIYQGNVTANYGGGLDASGGYTLVDVNFMANTAARDGGGTHQYLLAGPVPSSVTGGTFQANRANGGSGGAIFAFSDPLVVSGTLILSNTATGSGGGVFNYDATRIINTRLENNNIRAVYSQKALEIINSDFIRNRGSSGAGAFSYSGNVNVSDSSFIQTTATDSGGVLFINLIGGGSANITNTIFLSTTGGTGGTLFVNYGGELRVTDSHFENSKSTGPGGAIFSSSPIILNNTDFISNTSVGNYNNGGAIFGEVTVTGGRFERNQAYSGGAIWAQGSTATISGTQFISNTALGTGAGAVWGNGSTITITNSAFIGNVANGLGGGAVWASGTSQLEGVTFTNNRTTASNAGGGALWANSTTDIRNSTFTDNVANGMGGGAVWANNTSQLENVTFTNNRIAASNAGGGALWANNTTDIRNSTFMSNTSAGWAGALFLQNTFTLSNTTFIANNAVAAGGGLARGGPTSTGPGLIVNSLFARNTAGGAGAAIAIETNGLVKIVYTTIGSSPSVTGTAIAVGVTSQVSVTNTIINGYDTGISQGGTSTVSEDYNLFFDNGVNTAGTVSGGTNSLTGDPGFADAAADNYRLTVPSAALGSAVDQGVYTDYFGDVRPQFSGADSGFDIGFDELAYVYDVALAKSVSPATLLPGDSLTYTIHFSNTESGQASGIVISDTLPAGVTITAITSSTIGKGVLITQTSGSPLPSAAGTFSWAVNELEMGEGGVITLTGVVSTSQAVAGTLITNTATIQASYDLTETNNVGAAGVQVKPYVTIGGQVSGLAGTGLALQNNGGDDLSISANGVFTFATPQLDGETYSVTVQTQPTGPLQECTVANSSGTVATVNITDIGVTCSTITYTLTLVEVGNGAATADPALTDYLAGTIVTITATPDTGYSFSGWSGDVVTTTNPVAVTLDADKVITATFTQNSYALTVDIVGNGSVEKSPDALTYTHGTQVTLTPTPDTGYSFSGWSGACTGSGACVVTMDEAKSVTATFTQNSYALTVNVVGSGSVEKSPDALTYLHGTQVTLIATPDTNYSFSGWSGACTGSGACVVTMDAAKSVTATFTTLNAAIDFAQTVGTDPSTCANAVDVIVFTGTTIYYCYTVTNVGAVTLTNHTLEQSALGVIFANLNYELAPTETTNTVQLGEVVSQTVTVSSSTVATWTASTSTPVLAVSAIDEEIGDVVAAVSNITVADAALTVQITVGSEANSCAATQNVVVPTGSQVYFCVTLTNTGAVTLTDFILRLTTGDVEFPGVTLAPGGTIQFTSADTALLGPITVDRLISMGVTIEALGDGTVLGLFTAQSQADSTAAQQPTALEPGEQPNQPGIPGFLPWLTK